MNRQDIIQAFKVLEKELHNKDSKVAQIGKELKDLRQRYEKASEGAPLTFVQPVDTCNSKKIIGSQF